MNIPRYYTIAAIALDTRSLRELMGRLAALDLTPGSIVLTRRRDKHLTRVLLPEAHGHSIEGDLSRTQWFELASVFFSASTVSFFIGVVRLWTGLLVQAVLTVAEVIGLGVYRRCPCVDKKLLRLGIPERSAGEWGPPSQPVLLCCWPPCPKSTSTRLRARFSKTIRSSLCSPLTGDPCFDLSDR